MRKFYPFTFSYRVSGVMARNYFEFAGAADMIETENDAIDLLQKIVRDHWKSHHQLPNELVDALNIDVFYDDDMDEYSFKSKILISFT